MKSAEQWFEEIQSNNDYDKWRYNYQKFQSLIAAIQSDARKQGVLDGLQEAEDIATLLHNDNSKSDYTLTDAKHIEAQQTILECFFHRLGKIRAAKMKEFGKSPPKIPDAQSNEPERD